MICTRSKPYWLLQEPPNCRLIFYSFVPKNINRLGKPFQRKEFLQTQLLNSSLPNAKSIQSKDLKILSSPTPNMLASL